MESKGRSIVQGDVMTPDDGSAAQRIDEYRDRLFSFQLSMAVVRRMLSEGLITAEEYADIDTILTKKHGIYSSSICR